MIYEKRNGLRIRVSPDDLQSSCITVVDTPRCTSDTNAEGAITGSEIIQREKPRKKTRRFSGFAVVFATVIFCLFTADRRLFDGKLLKTVSAYAKNTFASVSEHSNDTPSQTVPQRTLYTLEYAESSETETVSQKNSVPHQSPNLTVLQEIPEDSAKAVSGTSSQMSVDGTKYYPITSSDLSSDNIYALANATAFNVDARELSQANPSSLEGITLSDGPLVLVLHTHGCESYSEYNGEYPENAPTRSEDIEKNVVRVGREICDTLAKFGVPSVHCQTLHDKDSFINAYSESAKTAKAYLEKYPSIKFIIDVHRDAIIRDNGESVKAVANIGGENFAQLMFVVGTNELGHNHPGWTDNLSLAVRLQEGLGTSFPGLCRNINLRNVPFNQQLSSGYILLETGTCANTLDEALRSGRAFGQELARIILQNAQ